MPKQIFAQIKHRRHRPAEVIDTVEDPNYQDIAARLGELTMDIEETLASIDEVLDENEVPDTAC